MIYELIEQLPCLCKKCWAGLPSKIMKRRWDRSDIERRVIVGTRLSEAQISDVSWGTESKVISLLNYEKTSSMRSAVVRSTDSWIMLYMYLIESARLHRQTTLNQLMSFYRLHMRFILNSAKQAATVYSGCSVQIIVPGIAQPWEEWWKPGLLSSEVTSSEDSSFKMFTKGQVKMWHTLGD